MAVKIADGLCQSGCGRATLGKKWGSCRVCSIARVKGRKHPYGEPCVEYVAEPVAHLMGFTCSECGFDSAEHPGGGRANVSVVLGSRA